MCDDKKTDFATYLMSLVPGALSFVDSEIFNELYGAIEKLIKEGKSLDKIFDELKEKLKFKEILRRLGKFGFKKLIGGFASLSLLYEAYTENRKNNK